MRVYIQILILRKNLRKFECLGGYTRKKSYKFWIKFNPMFTSKKPSFAFC